MFDSNNAIVFGLVIRQVDSNATLGVVRSLRIPTLLPLGETTSIWGSVLRKLVVSHEVGGSERTNLVEPRRERPIGRGGTGRDANCNGLPMPPPSEVGDSPYRSQVAAAAIRV